MTRVRCREKGVTVVPICSLDLCQRLNCRVLFVVGQWVLRLPRRDVLRRRRKLLSEWL